MKFFTSYSIKVTKIYLFILCSLFSTGWSFGQSCDCINPPNCVPCEGSLTSLTLRYDGETGTPNRYRVSDDGGQFVNGFLSEEIVINSRNPGQPFEGNRLVIRINVGGGFGDGIEILTDCNEIKLGQEYDNGNFTVISAISSSSGPICCATEDLDTEPPEIADCPADVELNADSNCEAFYTWTEPTATDNCGTVVFTEQPTANSGNFPVGETLIQYVAEDDNGNEATCQFTITVRDESIPVFTDCPDNIEVPLNDNCNAIVEWQEPNVADNCGVATIDSNFNPGDLFPVGLTDVIYTATDNNGNQAICQFTVNVTEENEPVFIECPSDIEIQADISCKSIVEWDEPEVSENCGVITIESNYNPGDEFPVGTTEVIYTALNANGYEAICKFNVIVIDSSNPEVSNCPVDIHKETSENESLEVEWDEPILNGGCASEYLQSTHQSGDEFPVGETEVQYSYVDKGETVIACSFSVNVILKEVEFDIPKLLTINNDGINDEWELGGIEVYPENQVIIFDRWGGEVFKVSGYNNAQKIWRGENKNGSLVPAGTYFYIIKAISNSAAIEKTGYLELVR